jgi:hypothetical protein
MEGAFILAATPFGDRLLCGERVFLPRLKTKAGNKKEMPLKASPRDTLAS